MNIPPEMEYLSTCFFQRSDLDYETAEDWVKSRVLDFLDDPQRKIVKTFLDDLLSTSVTEKELVKLWSALDSDFWIGELGARRFFELIRDTAGST